MAVILHCSKLTWILSEVEKHFASLQRIISIHVLSVWTRPQTVSMQWYCTLSFIPFKHDAASINRSTGIQKYTTSKFHLLQRVPRKQAACSLISCLPTKKSKQLDCTMKFLMDMYTNDNLKFLSEVLVLRFLVPSNCTTNTVSITPRSYWRLQYRQIVQSPQNRWFGFLDLPCWPVNSKKIKQTKNH